MARRKQGRRIKHKTQKETDTSQQAADLPPRALVFSKGKVSAPLKALVNDLKNVMSPNTARALRAQRRNKLRDFVDVAGSLNVSFFLIVSSTDKSAYLRLIRSPRGPTLTFRIKSYALAADLAASLRRPYSAGHGIWQSNPLLVLSDFDQSKQEQALTSTMLRNLFPPINVQTLQISACRRVVMLHQESAEEGGGIQLRQYVIKAAATNVTRGVKKLMRGSKVPALGRYASMADFLAGTGGYSSESAAETDDDEKVELPQDYVGRGAAKNQQVGVRLLELGPRLTLELLKVEEGVCDGPVLYHALVSKTDEEAAQDAATRQARIDAKEARKRAQEENVARKRSTKDEKAARRKRRREGGEGAAGEADSSRDVDGMEGDMSSDGGDGADEGQGPTDAEWYEREVGEAPEEGLFGRGQKAQKRAKSDEPPAKHKFARKSKSALQ